MAFNQANETPIGESSHGKGATSDVASNNEEGEDAWTSWCCEPVGCYGNAVTVKVHEEALRGSKEGHNVHPWMTEGLDFFSYTDWSDGHYFKIILYYSTTNIEP